jgi:hypothetical protein
MKSLPLLILLVSVGLVAAQEPDDRVVLVPWKKAPPEAPLFFSAAAEVDVRVGLTAWTGVQKLAFRIHQGRADTLTLALAGPGDVTAVTGVGLRDWAVRVDEHGARFLDLHPAWVDGKPPMTLEVTLATRGGVADDAAVVMLPGPGAATGFSMRVNLADDGKADFKVVGVDGLQALDASGMRSWVGTGVASLGLKVTPAGTPARGLELLNPVLHGRVAADGGSVSLHLEGVARAAGAGSALDLGGDGLAIAEGASGDGWHVALRRKNNRWVHELVAERAGDLAVGLNFEVAVTRDGEWSRLAFDMPAGVVVPVVLEGLRADTVFDRKLAVVPEPTDGRWRGFLPAAGAAVMAWRGAGPVADGAMFFSSTETTEVRVGNGLSRQRTRLDLRVLQGKLDTLALALDGPGEVLAVQGVPVIGWAVREADGHRIVDVKLSRAIEDSASLTLEAQSATGALPVDSPALRVTPRGALRHSGWLRVANEGAVRVEVVGGKGLVQLEPAQFPGEADASLRQVFVYRFPSADYSYAVRASQVMPEVGLTEVTVHELAETDRRMVADLELDIREAPLREFSVWIPADHAVASVSGPEVADHALAAGVQGGFRTLKVIFKQEVSGRQWIGLRLEKNEAAKAGGWDLPALGFPEVKSRRGYIGAVAAAGYRLAAGRTSGLAEVPVTFFPKKTAGLQQAFRIRETEWRATLAVEALGQSIQADVFHLYSLKPGAAYGSVLVNYFVVGAPATEWRLNVPEGIGNIDVTGQNVGRDWRREGTTLVVPLTRPILGTGTLLVTFEQAMGARGGTLSPGGVAPLAVQGERGYVRVVSPLQVNHKSAVSGALLGIDPSELPAEFRLLSSAPTLGVWQYTARDFKIGMEIEWFEAGDTVAQMIDSQHLASRVSRDGQWVTDARLVVKSRGRAVLRMTMPEGATLWQAEVDGGAVNARADDGATLVPLPVHGDPNQVVSLALRYGGRAADSARITLAAPRFDAPVVIGAWSVSGDRGCRLIPRGGLAGLSNPLQAETGWQWWSRHPGGAWGLMLAGLAAWACALGDPPVWRRVLGLIGAAAFIALAVVLGIAAVPSLRLAPGVLEYTTPVIAAGDRITVEIGHAPAWMARAGWPALSCLGAGLAFATHGLIARKRWSLAAGLALVAAALLTAHGGAVGFCALAIAVGLRWCLPALAAISSALSKLVRRRTAVAALLVVALLPWFPWCHATGAEALDPWDSQAPAESMIHDWTLRDGRLYGTVDITVRAVAGQRFVLVREPAVLTGFEGASLRVIKARPGGVDEYLLVADAAGRLTGRASFEMPVADPAAGWDPPFGMAALRRVTLRWDQGGWDFTCDGAAKLAPLAGLPAGHSGAVAVLGPVGRVQFKARPKQRDATLEETRYFSEVSNLFISNLGVVNGRHRVTIRPAQGRVAALTLGTPVGFTVSDVADGPVGSWRFDPEKRELRIAVEPAQTEGFSFTVETQRGAGEPPVELEVGPVRVEGAADATGFLGLAFGDEVQADSVSTEGLTRLNPGDLDSALLPRDKDGRPLALLQHAFRHGADAASARIKLAAVAPELRAESSELVSLGEDRLVVVADLAVTITRAGLFRIPVEIPAELDIESATGDGLSHWTEERAPGKRRIMLHLAGCTLGRRTFAITLAGKPPGAQAAWQVPRISVAGAMRETGVLTVVPERGLQVRAASRANVSQIDPRELAGGSDETSRAAARPGALVYRLLQGDWSLSLAISRLDPWVTAKVLHDATLREGQLLTRVRVTYKIENAAVKFQTIRIPGLDAAAAATVRATGPAVADLVPIGNEPGNWRVVFQRGIAGETDVEFEYQSAGPAEGSALLEPVVPDGVRQLSYFAVIRAGGRIEVDAVALPRGWRRSDWSVVQSSFGLPPGGVAPALCFSVADPEGPLPLVIKRHALAELRKLRISQGALTTLLSPTGQAITVARLEVEVVAKGPLRVRLPAGAALVHVFVNDEGAALVRDGTDWLFHVAPPPEADTPAVVRLAYSARMREGVWLEGPLPDAPMENLSWRVLVPEGWQMARRHGGDFDLTGEQRLGEFRIDDYQSFVTRKRESDARSAVALLDRANAWLEAGDQEKAGLALGNAVNNGLLDEASGEDARIQLRTLKTQQAVLGLNTRRQKLAIDNRFAAAGQAGNPQLDRAAQINPVMHGLYNFDPKQFDRFLEGNTADENSALKEIANRIVSQQLAAEPAPAALDLTLPERGVALDFRRSVQIEDGRPMAIELHLRRAGTGLPWIAMPLCLLIAAAAIGNGRRRA